MHNSYEWTFKNNLWVKRLKDRDDVLWVEADPLPSGKFLYGYSRLGMNGPTYCDSTFLIDDGKKLALEAWQKGLKL